MVRLRTLALRDSKRLVNCKQEFFGKICTTANKTKLRCEQLVADGESIVHKLGSTEAERYKIPSYAKGTVPLGDIFWVCEGDERLKTHLKPGWMGICAPAMLTGKVTILVPPKAVQRKDKRDT